MIEHLILALAIQTIVAWLFRSWGAGAAAATVWFISREVAQAEYRWIEAYGGGLRANMPFWGGFDFRVWQSSDPWLDWIVPVALTIAIALVAGRRKTASGSKEVR